ncbi:MAG: hydantoinase B/oxoprolinase family protein [Actinobacteria bacterium]|nr:hydantoinase B/oxoprolinase family protein [Actinomycetota bacterium]
MTPDPVTVEVIRNAFNSIAAQMNNNLARSAYTPIIYEMKDCSVGIFDVHGQLLGQAPGLPIFLGNLEAAIHVTTAQLGGNHGYREGDVFAVNDSYLTGSHLNDVSVFSPVFHRGELIGFCATKAHWLDIGAKDPSQAMDSTEIYEEGYRLGPTHLYVAGEPAHETIDFLTRNSRLSRSIWGDMHAQIAACRTGEIQLQALHDRFGRETIEAAAEAIFAQSERLDREAVAQVPDGVYTGEGLLDSWGPGGKPVPVKVTVTVAGDELVLDLTGSSPQTPGCLNCGLAQTISGARLAFKFLFNPDVPVTGGTFRNMRIVAEPGSVFDAHEPAACQYYYPHLGLMIDLFIRVLAPAIPELVVAGQPADPMNIMFTGHHPRTGAQFVCGEATAVGWGAYAQGDGTNALINYGGGDLKNLPVEVLESLYPLRIHRYGLWEGSGGEGRHRGGLGVVREYETLVDEIGLSLWFERTLTPGWGLFEGKEGRVTSVTVDRGDGPTEILKVNRLPLPRGSRVLVQTGGGGGFGDPAERDPEAVRNDVADGYVSNEGGSDAK